MPVFPAIAASAMKLPDNIAFRLFGLEFYWYGLLLAIGVILAIVLAQFESRRKQMPKDTAVDLCLVTLPLGVIGARIAYVLMNLKQFKGRAVEALYIWDGGLSAIGAVVLALVGILIYARKKRYCPLKLLDIITPGINAAVAISAWGYFFNQEFYGPLVTNSALKWFPLCVRLSNGEIHLALFFYLFVWLVLLFAFLWFRLRKRAKHNGDVTLVFVLFYSLALAVLSALRQDGFSRYLFPQIGGALVFAIVLIFLIARRVREKRLGRLVWPSGECCKDSGEQAATDTDGAVEPESPAPAKAAVKKAEAAPVTAEVTEPALASEKATPKKAKSKAATDAQAPVPPEKATPATEKASPKRPAAGKKPPVSDKPASKNAPPEKNTD